ncbi:MULTISPECIES: helicase-related protein [unclassified Paenibacillus]|uniref:helicase-related protein n=1 Tax=unclassified Paenibacillus TaxID=185978 RepID=UPI000955D272|nr:MULTISPECIES: helicase-related protein [unclassified Paenibacillus]QID16113.1 DEAD/DEAH box helicase [Paenibacillus sp. RUD330]SIQ84473.1 competence protein ComFA [Paenibacillus sp. RU4X]SIR05338.1 competence protein ComFA [Paenibacillus sp. RU4T]
MEAAVYISRSPSGNWQAGLTIVPEIDRLWLLNAKWRKEACSAAGEDDLPGAEEVLACGMLPLDTAVRAAELWEEAGLGSIGSRQAEETLARCAAEAEGQRGEKEQAPRRQTVRWEADWPAAPAAAPGGAAELARAACAAAAALQGRALLRGETHALLGAAGAAGSCDAALQLAALLGRLRLGSAVAALAGRGRPGGFAALRCRRCGSGKAQLRRAECASCGRRSCAYCEACLAMGRSRQCGLLVLGMPQPNRRAAAPVPPQTLPPAADRLRRWRLSPAQSAAASAALQFIERPALPGSNHSATPAAALFPPSVIAAVSLDTRSGDSAAGLQAHAERSRRSSMMAKVQAPLFDLAGAFRSRFCRSASPLPAFLIWAVTGAGKTEMVFPLLESVLSRGGRVLVAAPRRDVVLELAPRVRRAFPDQQVVALYGGSSQRWESGSITLATTHQLLRFREAFDLVVVDEIDAFPYAGDPLLARAAAAVCRRGAPVILLTATPGRTLRRLALCGRLPHAKVPVRYHGHALPVPQRLACPPAARLIEAGSLPRSLAKAIRISLARDAQIFVFVSRIRQVEPLTARFAAWFPGTEVAGTHSGDPERGDKVLRFRERAIRLLVTTTILERGVTVPKSDVFVLDANDRIFGEASLVQIAGRAGRSADDPGGRVYFAAPEYTGSQAGAIRQIHSMNRLAGSGAPGRPGSACQPEPESRS